MGVAVVVVAIIADLLHHSWEGSESDSKETLHPTEHCHYLGVPVAVVAVVAVAAVAAVVAVVAVAAVVVVVVRISVFVNYSDSPFVIVSSDKHRAIGYFFWKQTVGFVDLHLIE